VAPLFRPNSADPDVTREAWSIASSGNIDCDDPALLVLKNESLLSAPSI